MSSCFTAAELTEQIAAWKAALLAVSKGQKYTIGSRSLDRTDVKEIRNTITWLCDEQASLSGDTSNIFVQTQGIVKRP